MKKRAYEQRISEVEHTPFTPLIFSASGGVAREDTTFYKRLASLLSVKKEQPCSSTMGDLINSEHCCHGLIDFFVLSNYLICSALFIIQH